MQLLPLLQITLLCKPPVLGLCGNILGVGIYRGDFCEKLLEAAAHVPPMSDKNQCQLAPQQS